MVPNIECANPYQSKATKANVKTGFPTHTGHRSRRLQSTEARCVRVVAQLILDAGFLPALASYSCELASRAALEPTVPTSPDMPHTSHVAMSSICISFRDISQEDSGQVHHQQQKKMVSPRGVFSHLHCRAAFKEEL